jgi:hypothetical protein
MEDPVFGNVDNQLRPRHASNIFDDMDFADVPEDMRDILSVASDHTDEVVLDSRCFAPPMKCDDLILGSPTGTKETTPLTTFSHSPREQNSNSDCSLPFPAEDIHMVEFVPPAGSFVQKSTKRNQDQEIAFQSPPPPRNAKPSPSSKSAKKMTRSRPTKTSTEPPPKANSYAFVPASGSFNKRAPRKSDSGIARDRDAVLKDVAIVAQNIAIEAQVEALFPESRNEQTMSQLSASFSNLNNSISSFSDSFHNGVFVSKPASRQIPAVKSQPKAKRRSSNPHEHYVPPAAPGQGQVSQASRDVHRALPSLDSMFAPNSAAPASKCSTVGEQEFEVSGNSLQLHFEKPVEKNINHLVDPLWASLAQIDDPSMALSSMGPSISKGKPPRADNTKASNHSKTSRTSKSTPDNSTPGQQSKRKSQRKHKAGRRSSHPKQESTEKQESSPTPVVG